MLLAWKKEQPVSLHKLLADSCGDEVLDLRKVCPHILSATRHSLCFASSNMLCGLTNTCRADPVVDIHPKQPAVQHQFSWAQRNMRGRPLLGICLLQKTRCISIGSYVDCKVCLVYSGTKQSCLDPCTVKRTRASVNGSLPKYVWRQKACRIHGPH